MKLICLHHSVRNQQAQLRFESNALFARERDAVAFSAVIGIGSGKSDGHDFTLPYRPRAEGRRVLLVSHLALPFAVGASVGAIGIKEGIAAAQRAVAHDHDALIAALDAIEHLYGDMVEAIPDRHVGRARLVPSATIPVPVSFYQITLQAPGPIRARLGH